MHQIPVKRSKISSDSDAEDVNSKYGEQMLKLKAEEC